MNKYELQIFEQMPVLISKEMPGFTAPFKDAESLMAYIEQHGIKYEVEGLDLLTWPKTEKDNE